MKKKKARKQGGRKLKRFAVAEMIVTRGKMERRYMWLPGRLWVSTRMPERSMLPCWRFPSCCSSDWLLESSNSST